MAGNRFRPQRLLGVSDTTVVVDATTSLDVEINLMSINAGVPNNPDACMFSIGCRFTDPDIIRTAMYKTRAYIFRKNDIIERYNIPANMQEQIALHDAGKKDQVIPGTYTLKPPIGTQVLGQAHRAGKPSKGGKSPVVRHSVVRGFN